MLEIIVRNSAKCLDCGDEIESKWGHDFRRCSCGHLAVDGGLEYTRQVYKEAGHWQDTSIFAEQPATKEDLAEARELLALANAGARPKPEVYARAPLLDDWRIVRPACPRRPKACKSWRDTCTCILISRTASGSGQRRCCCGRKRWAGPGP